MAREVSNCSWALLGGVYVMSLDWQDKYHGISNLNISQDSRFNSRLLKFLGKVEEKSGRGRTWKSFKSSQC